MNWQTLTTALVLTLPGFVLTSCNTFSKQSVGLRQADDLVGRIERVHVECELSQEAIRTAITTLHTIVSPDFDGDAMAAFKDFKGAIKASEDRYEELENRIEPMKKTATRFFEQWTVDMETFTSAQMRQRSQTRYTQSKQRYDTIEQTIKPTQRLFGSFNRSLKDVALFLSHDFNAGPEIEGQVRSLTRQAQKLTRRFDRCLQTSRNYIQASSLPINVEVEAETAETDEQ